uniref:Uncharacterized protein n=1 Tax=Oryza punctata TaxID=4537 RepID=A0A0E0L0I2_ORYPU
MANLNTYHVAIWADSAKTRNPTRSGSSHENMWLHVRLRSMAYEVKSLIDQGNLPTTLAHSSAPPVPTVLRLGILLGQVLPMRTVVARWAQINGL